MKELVNQWGERESQSLANVDFRPIDVIHLPPSMSIDVANWGPEEGKAT